MIDQSLIEPLRDAEPFFRSSMAIFGSRASHLELQVLWQESQRGVAEDAEAFPKKETFGKS